MLLCTRIQHAHDFNDDKSKTLPVRIKQLLLPFAEMPTARYGEVFRNLDDNGIDNVTDFQATEANRKRAMAFVARERKKKTKTAWSGRYGALSQFAEQFGVSDADIELLDDHEFFVLQNPTLNEETEEIVLMFTTKFLLLNLEKGPIVCNDGTYRMNWQGCPLVILGTVDIGQHFHPAIYALVRGESNVELGKIFKDTFGALQAVLGRDVAAEKQRQGRVLFCAESNLRLGFAL